MIYNRGQWSTEQVRTRDFVLAARFRSRDQAIRFQYLDLTSPELVGN